jgi:hypothetical protein
VVWYHADMLGFPIAEPLDDSICLISAERYLHLASFACHRCHSPERRLFPQPREFHPCRCRTRDGYYTLLTNTVFKKTSQRPATLVLLLRGIAKGAPSACLAREWGMSRQQLPTLRRHVETHLGNTVSAGVMAGTTFAAAELY